MKPNSGMKSKLLSLTFGAIVLGSASLMAIASPNNPTIAQTPGGVSYVSGGVGDESIDRLNSMADEFNLKLVFAMQSGEYVSDVKVVISDAKGKTILDTTSEGPWLLVRLPTGRYQIVAHFAGKAKKQQVSVGSAKLRTIDFRWASS